MLFVSLFYTLNQFFLSFLTLQSPYILLLTTFLLLFQFPSSVHYLASDTFSFLLHQFYFCTFFFLKFTSAISRLWSLSISAPGNVHTLFIPFLNLSSIKI